MSTIKGDPKQPKKTVAKPDLPDDDWNNPKFSGFSNDFKQYKVKGHLFNYQKVGFATTDRLTSMIKEHDEEANKIRDLSIKLEQLQDEFKDYEKEKDIPTEKIKEFTDMQLQINDLVGKQKERKKEIVKQSCNKLLKEKDNTPFDKKWFDDDSISFNEWFRASVDLINFLMA